MRRSSLENIARVYYAGAPEEDDSMLPLKKSKTIMAFVSVTRLRIRSVRFLPHFFWLTFLSVRQARRSAGNLRVDLLRDAHNTYWTLTAWDSEASMQGFMMSGAHRRAMPKLLEWCDEASV